MSVPDTEVDLSGTNVAFSASRLSTLRLDRLYEVLGTPESEELVRLDGKALNMGLPRFVVKAAEWDDWIDEDDENLRILDLGEAFHQGAEPKSLAQPGALRVPETIFADRFGYRVDLWRAGCMVRTSVYNLTEKVLT
jgi:hypothetical protein